MADPRRKSKMISLRLSDEEYEAMRALYASYGARNVSDFARLAVQRTISNSFGSDSHILTRVQELDGRLKTIEARFSLIPEREQPDE